MDHQAIGFSDTNILFSHSIEHKQWQGYLPELGSKENEIIAEEIYSSLQNDLYIGTPFKPMLCMICVEIFAPTVKHCLIDIRNLDGGQPIVNVISTLGNAVIEFSSKEHSGIFEGIDPSDIKGRNSKILEILDTEQMNISNFDVYIKNVVK
jgi:hypothetical protein